MICFKTAHYLVFRILCERAVKVGSFCIGVRMHKLHLLSLIALFSFPSFANGQETGPTIYLPNQEIHVGDLPALTAQTHDATAVLQASVETILHDKDLCCGKDSALGDAVAAADPRSLKDVAVKLQGRHLLSDGRPIKVIAEFVPGTSINSGQVIQSLRDKHAMLLQWDSHFYVLHGSVFDEITDYNHALSYSIRRLLLWDLRYSDERRELAFERETDDLSKVQGMLVLTVSGP